MSNRIASKLLIRPSLGIDEQTKVDHIGCPAGIDTRQRLYVKRTGHSSYIGHCFNCGGSGYYFGSQVSRPEEIKAVREAPVHKEFSLVDSLITKPSDPYPIHVKEYLRKYHISEEEAINDLHYKYNKKHDLLIMPFFHSAHRADTGYQFRNFYCGAIRYCTKVNGCLPASIVARNGVYSPIVLVEDQISAYRIMRESGGKAVGVALLGTGLSAQVKEAIIKTSSKFIIWMDNDAAGKAAAEKIYKELKPHVDIKALTRFEEPKSYDPKMLKLLIEEWVLK